MPARVRARGAARRLREFCRGTSLHGFPYLCAPAHWLVPLLWTLIILTCFSLCIFLWHMIWMKFVTDPTFTVVESTHHLTTEVAFPALLVCDPARVFPPAAYNTTTLLRTRFSDQQIQHFYKSFNEMRNGNLVSDPVLDKIFSLFTSLGISIVDLLWTLRKPCDVLITECMWRSKTYNCSDMFRETLTIYGYCCQFDIDYFSAHAAPGTNMAAGVETREALQVLMDPHDSDTLQLYVVEGSESVSSVSGAAALSAGGRYDVALAVWLIDSSRDVKALPLQDRRCTIPEDNYIGLGSYYGCLNTLIYRKIINYCQCVPFGLRDPELTRMEFPSCGWNRLMCTYQMLDREVSGIRGTLAGGGCFERCDYVQYDTEVQHLGRPPSLHSSPQDNLIQVSVKFSDFSCMKYRREVLYSWDQMLANLGGIFGLCLGGSVISAVELAWLAADLLAGCLPRRARPAAAPGPPRPHHAAAKKGQWTTDYKF